MASSARQKNFNLDSYFLNHAQYYQLQQFLYCLELLNETEFLLVSSSKLSFPETDIMQANLNQQGEKIFEISFMGLYGVDSPLPHHFLEEAIKNNESGQRVRSFLNIFNHHLYVLLFLAWKKTHPNFYLFQKDNCYQRHLTAISGNTLGNTDNFAIAGLFGMRIHSAAGLVAVLKTVIPDCFVQVKEFIPRWLEIAQDGKLGINTILSEQFLLGQRMLDASHYVRIEIGVFLDIVWEDLFFNKNYGKIIESLIKKYLEPTINYSICLWVKPSQNVLLMLGKDKMILGYKAWLGEMKNEAYLIHLYDYS